MQTLNGPERPGAEGGPSREPESPLSANRKGAVESPKPIKRDARIDTIERLLKATDWATNIQANILSFTEQAVALSPLATPGNAASISKLGEYLQSTSVLVTDAIEKRTIEYLTRTLGVFEVLALPENYLQGSREVDRREMIAKGRQSLQVALRASQSVPIRTRRESLQLMCSQLETELGLASKAIDRSEGRTLTTSE